MNRIDKKCPDCETEMVAGELLYGALHPVEWLERELAKSRLAALKPSSHYRRNIVSYRCPECGLLKDYAL
jgi:ssDNA-binding Zn-finger/Zn-ribbon topoisomerase 1